MSLGVLQLISHLHIPVDRGSGAGASGAYRRQVSQLCRTHNRPLPDNAATRSHNRSSESTPASNFCYVSRPTPLTFLLRRYPTRRERAEKVHCLVASLGQRAHIRRRSAPHTSGEPGVRSPARPERQKDAEDQLLWSNFSLSCEAVGTKTGGRTCDCLSYDRMPCLTVSHRKVGAKPH